MSFSNIAAVFTARRQNPQNDVFKTKRDKFVAKSKNSHRPVQKSKASRKSQVSAAAKDQRLESAAEVPVGPEMVMDRRSSQDRRKSSDRRKVNIPVAVERRTLERRTKVSRRRQIDPTTCERDYTAEEIEFMNALDQYKRSSGRMFPTCSEILEVLKNLGYRKETPATSESPECVAVEPVSPGLVQTESTPIQQ